MADTPAAALERRAAPGLAGLRLLEPARFTHATDEQAALWKIRQGLYPSVGAARKRGTAVLIEDVAVPVERLAEAVADLRQISRAIGTPTPSCSAMRRMATCTS